MGAYSYKALNEEGKTVKGLLEGDSERHIRTQLRAQRLKPLEVISANAVDKVEEKEATSLFGRPRGGKLSTRELSMLTRQLASLVKSGLPLDEALQACAKQTKKPKVKRVTLATGLKLKQDNDLGLIRGLYALCPYIAGSWPQARYPSSEENNGILLDLHNNRGRMAYGIEAFERGDPLAWPAFASVDDVKGLVPTVISVNECDPLRDEGIEFYRLLLQAGVRARCRQVMGTIHGTEIIAMTCPEISRETAASIAQFCREV